MVVPSTSRADTRVEPQSFADIARLNIATLNHLVEILGEAEVDYCAKNKKEQVANCQFLLRQRISGGSGGAGGSGGGSSSAKPPPKLH